MPARRAKPATDPPKRQRMQPEARRVLLMEAAARTFTRLGYDNARMEDVAKEAGVAKGLLYQHFASKDALFEALMEEKGERFRTRLEQRWAEIDAAGPGDLVVAGVAMWLDEATRDDAMVNSWASPEQWDRAGRFRDKSLDAIVDQISRTDPAVDPEVAWLVAAAYQGAVEAVTTQWRRRGRVVSRQQLESIIVSFALHGLDGMRGGPAPADGSS